MNAEMHYICIHANALFIVYEKTGIMILYYAELIAISKYIKEKYKGNFFAFH